MREENVTGSFRLRRQDDAGAEPLWMTVRRGVQDDVERWLHKTKRPLFREEQVSFVSLSQNKRKALLKEKRFFAG